jgi:WD40 repeat protein
LFNLLTSKSIEINSPKFYSPANCAKGYGYRPKTGSLALLARSGGKDIVSIHAGSTREAIRSWYPETVDAQALYWSPDGKWQAVLESAGQGHKILFYTADGHLYKAWNGPTPICAEDEHISLGAGVRIVQWAPKGDYFAVSDYGPQVMLLSAPTFVSKLNLCHKSTIQPITGLHIWQEQVMALPDNKFERGFTMCNATICPPVATASPVRADSTQTGGTNILSFDHSGTLLATRSESMPTTIWIWDLASKGLRAVLILHAPIARVAWHPSINEILLIRCEGEDSKGLVHLWEPSWETPKILDFGTQLPEGKILGKAVARWLNVNSATPCVFFSDTQDCILASLAESDEDDVPWQESTARGVDIYGQREESPLDLVPANETRMFSKALQEPTITAMSGFSDEVDDTFQFKKFVE